MFQQGKRKTKSLLDFYTKRRKSSCALYAHSQFLCSLVRFDLQTGMYASESSRTLFYARLLVFDMTSAKPDFSVVNCSKAVMSAFYSPVSTRSLIFLQL